MKDGELPQSQNRQVARLFVEGDGTMINLRYL